MRNKDDIEIAKLAVIQQLSRKDIGASHQRALLHGMLSALEWINGNGKVLQRLIDGHEIQVNNMAHIAGPTLGQGKHIIAS